MELKTLSKNSYSLSDPTAQQFKSLMYSIRQFGQLQPVLTRTLDNEQHEIIKGTTIVRALRELGVNEVWIESKGALDIEHAKLMYLSLKNKTDTDYIKTSDLVDEMIKEYEIAHIANCAGLTKEEIQEILRIRTFDWQKHLRLEETNQISLL